MTNDLLGASGGSQGAEMEVDRHQKPEWQEGLKPVWQFLFVHCGRYGAGHLQMYHLSLASQPSQK